MESIEPGAYEPDLTKFRDRLQVLAGVVIPRKLQARFDSSDVVQDTLLKAQDRLGQFRGASDGELFAWLQQILRRECVDTIRYHTASMRNPSIELSMQQTFNESFERLEKLLAADSSSPSSAAKRAELIIKALDALACLSTKERDAIVTYYLHGLSQQETADLLGMSKSDVSRSIEKGLKKLRDEFGSRNR
jgi:RNA polymerase sigma-70 factor (ECF subfamily)